MFKTFERRVKFEREIQPQVKSQQKIYHNLLNIKPERLILYCRASSKVLVDVRTKYENAFSIMNVVSGESLILMINKVSQSIEKGSVSLIIFNYLVMIDVVNGIGILVATKHTKNVEHIHMLQLFQKYMFA